ncbi:hypothetical protein MMF93_19975 [Streptomyces tubbatahanensis]|uniref:Uncharacterized protein n=1 Tax=Streptomyces tubbatahanensis TaxID=2923272 RepID=A0ABY3XVW1_9ACTN|nr:hypothetical protein [Streptomyces tubbatahanensis]UNS98478.1 hypothetical protein MMF93_19975 [Streptomyces tubbatahanensis]
MTAQNPGHQPERDDAVPAEATAPVPGTPPMSELLASCAAAAAVSSPPPQAASGGEAEAAAPHRS